MNSKLEKKVSALPRTPGVYLFRDRRGKILYIGKATYLRDRVRSYFSGRDTRGERIFQMVAQSARIDHIPTDTVLEALILEANLIRKYQPKYNVDRKDDKSFSFFVITKEKFPRVLILREKELEKDVENIRYQFGPYTSKKNMEVALGIIRKIFPFHSLKAESEKGCLDFQIGRCPGPYVGAISREDYQRNIRGIRMILEGKKKGLLKKLEQEMGGFSRGHEYEKAAEARNRIFALEHIRDVALISSDMRNETGEREQKLRIEAYDISNISGKQAVGSMVVFSGSGPDKSQYRKFRIKTVAGADDVGMMREVLLRRFGNDWPNPDLILLDGGQGHFNMGAEILRGLKLDIPLAAAAKGPDRKNLELRVRNVADSKIRNILDDKLLLKRIMDEAHRFAISYHKKVRKSDFISR